MENRIKFCYNTFCMFASKCKECIIKIVKTQIDKTEHMFYVIRTLSPGHFVMQMIEL